MAAQETNLYNAFETTLTATAGSSDLTFTVNSVTAPTSITLAVPFYLVINPDSSTNREVVEITSINTGTKTLTCSGIGKRYLAGSAATSGLSHASGSTVRMSPVEQHIEDLNDRVDTIINEAGTAVNTSLFLDEDDMSTDSATKGVTQQSVKAYVDAQVTAQDLDLISDSGTIDIDLDSESLTVSGGEGIDTSATGTTLTIAGEDASTSNKGVASFSSDNFAVSSGAVTIKDSGVDLTAEVTGTLPVGNGGTGATTLTDGGVLLGSGASAVTATAVLTNGQLLIGDGTGDPTVGSLTEGSNVTITPGAGSITIASTDTNTTYTAGTLLDLATTTFNVDLQEAAEAAIVDGDYVMFLDGGATGTAAKENIADIATLFAGTGLTASSSVIGVDTSQNITALTGGDLTIYEDANNADVSVKMGTSAAESLTIEVLNGTSDKTAEQINFTTATASTTANHGKMVFAVDEVTVATIDDDGIDLAASKNFSIDGSNLPTSDTTYTAASNGGIGLSGTAFSLDIDGMTDIGAAIVSGDLLPIDDGAGGANRKTTVDRLATLFAGDGLADSSAVIGLDLNELTAAAVNVANDSIAIIDADASNGTRKESIADLATAMAGTNITASAGVLSAAGGASGLTLISKDDFSAVGNVTKYSCFSGTYDNYKVIVDAIGLNTTYGDLRIQLTSGGDGTIDTTANMDFMSSTPYHNTGTDAMGNGIGDVDSAYWRLTSNNLKGPYPFTLEMDIINPYTSGKNTQATWQATFGYDAVFYSSSAGGGQKMETTQFDGIYLNWGVANSHTCTGTIRVYGYKSTV